MAIFFISGIDTNVGKTHACGALANTLLQKKYRTYTQKWVETGVSNTHSLDLKIHQEIAQCAFNTENPSWHAPYLFSYPASPHLAAAKQQQQICADTLTKATQALSARCEYLLIEGAGGLCVPINSQYLLSDLVKQLALPVILVTTAKLGSINQTLLSLSYCKQRNIEVKALIYNTFFTTSSHIEDDTRQVLSSYLQQHHPDTTWLELAPNANCFAINKKTLRSILY